MIIRIICDILRYVLASEIPGSSRDGEWRIGLDALVQRCWYFRDFAAFNPDLSGFHFPVFRSTYFYTFMDFLCVLYVSAVKKIEIEVTRLFSSPLASPLLLRTYPAASSV